MVGALLVAAMYGIGTLIAAVAPTVNSALALGLVASFAMMAVGGWFGSADALPAALAAVGERLPFGAGNRPLAAARSGERPDTVHLAALSLCAVVTGGLAAKLFRWT